MSGAGLSGLGAYRYAYNQFLFGRDRDGDDGLRLVPWLGVARGWRDVVL